MPELRPLQGGLRHQEGPPHIQSLCERCKKLGFNCRENNDAYGGSEDVESVASEDRGSSAGNSDEDHTPKGSDDDGDDEVLEKFGRLNLK